MSLPNSPTSGNRFVYRFISDPEHKETLSGRVRSACLTCRKKKTKCSGGANCRTCQEKGLECEGLPERKARNRNIGDSVVLDREPKGGISRKRKLSVSRRNGFKQMEVPLPTLAPLLSAGQSFSGNSGYSSSQAQQELSMLLSATPPSNVESALIPISMVDNIDTSQKALGFDNWHLREMPCNQNEKPQHGASYLQLQSEPSPGARLLPAGVPYAPPDWPHTQAHATWWSGDPTSSVSNVSKFTDLNPAAHLLEGQSQMPLKGLYEQDNIIDVNHYANAPACRESMAFQIPSRRASEPGYNVLGNRMYPHMQQPGRWITDRAPGDGISDDMTLPLMGRTPITGTATDLTEQGTWWDVQAGDLMSMFPATGNTPRSLGPLVTTQNPEGLPGTLSADGFFGQLWPG